MRSRLLVTVLLLALASAARGDAQIDAAIRALRSDSSLKVRAQAAIILGQRGAEEAVGALADAARNDSSEAVRLACISALAKIGDPAGRGAIEAALKDRDGRVRAAAQKALEGWPELLPAGPGAMTVSLEFPSGAGDSDLRSALRDVDGNGRVAAMLEGGARLKAVGTVQGPMVAKYAAKALDAAARTMTEDLADRLP